MLIKCSFTVIALFRIFDVFVYLITVTILNITCFLKELKKKNVNVVYCNYKEITSSYSLFILCISEDNNKDKEEINFKEMKL